MNKTDHDVQNIRLKESFEKQLYSLNPTSMLALTDLRVYQLAEQLSDMIWDDFDSWPEKAQRTVGLQVIRSSDSIASNLAEGYGRFTPPDRRNFYRYSRGSFEETKGWLRKLFRRKVINAERMESYDVIINELGPKLNAFINSTNKRYKI